MKIKKRSVCLLLDDEHFNKLIELQKQKKKGYSNMISDILDELIE